MGKMSTTKEYIGDGTYVEFDGYGLWLTTENGISTTNRIYLEPSVWTNLVQYMKNLEAKRGEVEDEPR